MAEHDKNDEIKELKDKGLCLRPDEEEYECECECEKCPHYAHSPGRQVVS